MVKFNLIPLLGLVAACAAPETKVLAPYQLADGRTYQDVVSIGSNGRGTAPTVTTLTTYALVDGPKGAGAADCGCTLKPVATSSGSQTGFFNSILPSVVGAATIVAAAEIMKPLPAAAAAPVPPPAIPLPSDKRLKSNVAHLVTLANGIDVYSFNYIKTEGLEFLDTETTYVGVLAQEVLETFPDAVSIGADGFLRVDYREVGFDMMTLEAWNLIH